MPSSGRMARALLGPVLHGQDPAWERLMRRRANRLERGLPLSLTVPVPPEAVAAPLPPAETVATGERPWTAAAAAILLWVLGAVILAHGVVELGLPALEVLGEPAVDSLTAIFHVIVAGFLGAVLVGILVLAAAHAYAGWRILEGVNWGFVEGLFVALMGAMLVALQFGVSLNGELSVGWPLVIGLGAYAAVVGLLVAARPWFGEIRFPLHPDRSPWWLRLGGRTVRRW